MRFDPASVDLYVQKEVTTEGIIRNLGAFARFLEAASFSHGSVLSASDVARECGVKRSTVDGYFAILNDMLLKTFRQDYPEARLVLLYRGETQFLRDGILVVPVESFLRALVPGRPPLAAFFPE